MLSEYFDTIVMNPPFGTNNSRVDMNLLVVAAKALKKGGQLFSIHKLKINKHDMTKNYIKKFVSENLEECSVEFLWEFEFKLPA